MFCCILVKTKYISGNDFKSNLCLLTNKVASPNFVTNIKRIFAK